MELFELTKEQKIERHIKWLKSANTKRPDVIKHFVEHYKDKLNKLDTNKYK